jgi:dimethylsulfoniopropionate demethylase
MGYDTSPLECGLDQYVSLDADINSLSLPALRQQVPARQLKGLVIDQACQLIDQNVYLGGQCVGQITSQAYSPKYGVHLAFVLCSLPALGASLTLDINCQQGTVSGRVTSLPFDFKDLGLEPKAQLKP